MTNRSEMLKNLKAMVSEKYSEVRNEILEAMKEAEGYDRGQHIDVIIDLETGEISTTGAMSQNWMTTGQWQGEYLTVASCEGWSIGSYGYDYDFNEAIQNENNYGELVEEYEAVQDDFNDLYDFIQAEHPELIEKMDQDYKEWLIKDSFPETADYKYDRFIDNLELEIENAEANEIYTMAK